MAYKKVTRELANYYGKNLFFHNGRTTTMVGIICTWQKRLRVYEHRKRIWTEHIKMLLSLCRSRHIKIWMNQWIYSKYLYSDEYKCTYDNQNPRCLIFQLSTLEIFIISMSNLNWGEIMNIINYAYIKTFKIKIIYNIYQISKTLFKTLI